MHQVNEEMSRSCLPMIIKFKYNRDLFNPHPHPHPGSHRSHRSHYPSPGDRERRRRVQPRGGFVREQHRRRGEDPGRHGQPLALTPREAAEVEATRQRASDLGVREAAGVVRNVCA